MKTCHFNLLHLCLAHPTGVIPLEFCRDHSHLWAIIWHCLYDHRFSRPGRTPICDGKRGRSTETQNDSVYRTE